MWKTIKKLLSIWLRNLWALLKKVIVLWLQLKLGGLLKNLSWILVAGLILVVLFLLARS